MTATTQPRPHAVFNTDLGAGVTAIARAIGVRQAGDLMHVLDDAPEYITAEGILAHVFPAGDCASTILEVSRLAEAAIPGLDMSPITDLMYDIDDRPIREMWTTPHDYLSVLASLSLGRHLVIEYTDDERLAVRRLFAAIHLAICGPLPVRTSRRIVGCAQCADDSLSTSVRCASELPHEIADAARDGELDPLYTPRVYPAGWHFGDKIEDDRKRAVRLTWKAPNEELTTLQLELTRLGFTAEIHRGWGLVVAQKPLERGSVYDAGAWGEARFARYADRGVEWYGAQTVFSLDRGPLE
jgi:hypothetical protein